MAFEPNIQGIRILGSLTGITSISVGSISATTYQGISTTDTFVTGGTYSSGTAIFTNSTGGTFSVTGFSTGGGGSTEFTGGTVTGATQFTNGLTADTFSATTYSNLPNNNLWTQSGSSIFYNSGNVGIGTSDTLYRLDVVASGGTTSFEDIARFRTIDSTDYLALTNGISTDGSFNPVLRSFNNTNVSTNFYVQSVIDPTVDTGDNPLIMLQGRVSSDPGNVDWSGVTTRPILRVRNNSNDLVQINADGNVGIGTITPEEKLDVSGNTIIRGTLNVTTLSTGTTINNLGIDSNGNVVSSDLTDVRLTGGTYSNGTSVFTNNTGGTFSVTGFSTGTTASNLASIGVFAQKSDDNLEFKGLTSTGGTVNITSDATTVNIESSNSVADANKIFSWFMNVT